MSVNQNENTVLFPIKNIINDFLLIISIEYLVKFYAYFFTKKHS